MNGGMRFCRYDYAAILSFATYAMCSVVIPMTLVPLAIDLGFPLEEGGMGLAGSLQLGRSITLVISMVFCGFASGLWGKRLMMAVGLIFMSLGTIAGALAPSYAFLLLVVCLSGLGMGNIEGLATPVVQDLHPKEPGKYLNFAHAFWSVGIVALVIVTGALLRFGVSWRIVVGFTGLIGLVPAVLFLIPDRKGIYPDVNEKAHWREICAYVVQIMRIKRFWLHFAAMFFAGGAEFCLTFWCASFIQVEYGGTAWAAGAGTAAFSAGMIVGRMGSSWLVPQDGLKRLILAMALLSTGVCLFFPFLQSLWWLFVLLFIAGVTAGPFWPSIQSYSSTRMRVDNTMLFVLLSCSGVPGCGVFTALMGVFGDWFGLRMSFLLVPACFHVTLAIIALDWRKKIR